MRTDWSYKWLHRIIKNILTKIYQNKIIHGLGRKFSGQENLLSKYEDLSSNPQHYKKTSSVGEQGQKRGKAGACWLPAWL